MAFVLEDIHLPATLTTAPMTDEEFGALCAEHSDLAFEMTAEGVLIVVSPNKYLASLRNGSIAAQLIVWAEADARGAANDSSGGFVLPNGARRSPDAAWVPMDVIDALDERHDRFLHACPAFVIELRSDSDRLPPLRAKMREWISNGSELAWLLDPRTRTVEINRPNRPVEVIEGCESIAGEGPVDGFVLDLRLVWYPQTGRRRRQAW